MTLRRCTRLGSGRVLNIREAWKDFNGIIAMMLVKRDDRWLIRALQNTVTSRAWGVRAGIRRTRFSVISLQIKDLRFKLVHQGF